MTVAFALFPLVRAPWEAFALNMLAGAGSGAFWPSQSALLNLLTPPARRHAAFAQQRMTMNLGIALGGLVAGLIARTAHPGTFTVLFLVDAATFVVFVAVLRLVPAPQREQTAEPGRYADVLRNRTFLAYVALNVVFIGAGIAVASELLPAFAKNTAHVSERAIGVLWFEVSLVVALAQLPVVKLVEGRRRMRGLALMGIVWGISFIGITAVGDRFDGTTAAIALALPLGPVLGGLLLQHFSWNSVFWINAPAAGVTLVVGAVLTPESRKPGAPPLDVPGAALSTAAVTCLVWGFINGPEHGWTTAATPVLLAASAVLAAAFGVRERRAAHPVIDPALFADRRFTWGTAATIAVSVALYGILFTFPQYSQSVLGEDPVGAALRLLPMMGGLLAGGGAASPVARASGTRVTVAAGLAMLAAGLAVLSQVRLGTGYAVVAAGLALCGLGTGASIGAAMNVVMAAAGGDEAGIGASVNSALRNAAGAITVAVLGGVLSATYARDLRPALAALPARYAATAQASITQAGQVAGRLPSGGPALRAAAGTAFLHGMSTVMLGCAAVAIVGMLTSLRYLPGRDAPGGTSSPRAPAAATDAGARR
jgi:MFS family permease